jgi:hypothetical protein
MSGASKIPFSKPWLSYADQVQLLQQAPSCLQVE